MLPIARAVVLLTDGVGLGVRQNLAVPISVQCCHSTRGWHGEHGTLLPDLCVEQDRTSPRPGFGALPQSPFPHPAALLKGAFLSSVNICIKNSSIKR